MVKLWSKNRTVPLGTLPETAKKYGYRMYDCSVEELKNYTKQCLIVKKMIAPATQFGYRIFDSIEHGINSINSIFVPADHGNLPAVHWQLEDGNTLLVKTIEFYNPVDQTLYQSSVERAWALGGHLDPRVDQVFYD
jgi:hypothetical protein